MTTLRYNFHVQLKDAFTLAPIITAGGVAQVCKNGLASKQACTDKDGSALANPIALVRGSLDFWCTSMTNDKVDLYIQCPGGQFVVARNISPSGPNEILVNTNDAYQCMVIPWAAVDITAATETDTGFDEPAANTAVFTADSNGPILKVVTVDATETIDIGTISTDSGDADGFMSAADVATAGIVRDVAALMTTLVGHVAGGKSITITTSAGSDTGLGFFYLPYMLLSI